LSTVCESAGPASGYKDVNALSEEISQDAMSQTGYSVHDFSVFLAHFRGEIVISTLFLLLGFGQKLFSNAFSVDTQSIIQAPESVYGSWFELERFGLVWLKRLLRTDWYNNAVASFLMVVLLGIDALLWAYLFYKATDSKELYHPAFFMVPFVVSPVLAEQLGFLLQAPEVDIAMMFTAISLMYLSNAIQSRKWWQYVVSVVFASASISIYTALITMFVPAVAMLFLLKYRHTKKMTVKMWLFIAISAGVCMASYITYFLANKIVMKAKGLDVNPYVSDQSRWGKDSLGKITQSITDHYIQIYAGNRIYYSVVFTLLSLMVTIFFVILVLRRRLGLFYWVVFELVCASPMLMSVILGSVPSVRTEISYPLAFAFVVFLAASELSALHSSLWRALSWILVALIGLNQGLITNRIFYTESVVYNQDVLLSRSIADRIGEVSGTEIPSVPVVFEGSHSAACNKSCFNSGQLDLVGSSIFSITFSTQHGTAVKNQFMGTQGFQYAVPSKRQIKEADTKSQSLPHWPAQGSVVKEKDYIVVNF
jgi:hypothetical protein